MTTITTHAHELEDLAALNNGLYPADRVTSKEMEDLSAYAKYTMPEGDTTKPIKGKMMHMARNNRLNLPERKCCIEARGKNGSCTLILAEDKGAHIEIILAQRNKKLDWSVVTEKITYIKEAAVFRAPAPVTADNALKTYDWSSKKEKIGVSSDNAVNLARQTLGNFMASWHNPLIEKKKEKAPAKINETRKKKGKTEITPFTTLEGAK